MITVNKQEIPQDAIFNEMQYHPANSLDEAQFLASRSLIIEELIRQRAVDLSLLGDEDSLSDDIHDKVLEHDVKTPSATQEDCQRYYDQNQIKFKTFPLIAARHILLKAAPEELDEREKLREHAEQLIEQLKGDPEKFAMLAKQFSACPSKETGGQLGQLSKGQTVPEFESALVRFDEGLIPTPIESRYGIHVVLIDQKIEGKQMPFDMVEQQINDYLSEKVERKAIAQYLAQLINEANIEGIDLGVDERHAMQ